MKKYIFLLFICITLLGCQATADEPEKKVEEDFDQPQQEETTTNNAEQPNETDEQVYEGKQEEQEEQEEQVSTDDENIDKDEVTEVSTADDPKDVAIKIVGLMEQKDIKTLANFVHPKKGVRFSPYAYVDTENHLVFSSKELQGILEDDTLFNWGNFDGSGLPIEMTFTEYFHRFIYDADYLQAEEIIVNERLGEGTTIDNSQDVYPHATIVEFHFSEVDPQYEGMDWRSLRLVLEKEEGKWYLIGVIHDEWTI